MLLSSLFLEKREARAYMGGRKEKLETASGARGPGLCAER